MIERYDDLKNFFISRPVTELMQFECYIDYKSLFRDVLTPENQENLPRPLEEIQAYREKFRNDERTFMKLGLDKADLGVDLADYFDYKLYTDEFIKIYQVEDKDVGYLINEGWGPELFEELDAWVKEIPQLFHSDPSIRNNKPKDEFEYDEDDIDDLEYYDEDEQMPDDFFDEDR